MTISKTDHPLKQGQQPPFPSLHAPSTLLPDVFVKHLFATAAELLDWLWYLAAHDATRHLRHLEANVYFLLSLEINVLLLILTFLF